MKKETAILKIESFTEGFLVLSVQDAGVKTLVKAVTDKCMEKYGGYMRVDMSPPYPARTTGRGSQNSHIWGHIQQISEYTGYEIDDVEDMAKRKAVSMGYPYRTNSITGEIIPYSMKDINTQEAGYLIDVLHQWAAELEINLDEGV